MGTVELAGQALLMLLTQAQQFQAKIAAGTITDTDVDAVLAQVGSSRDALAQAIANAKASGAQAAV